MAHRTIKDRSLAARALASALLMRALRDNHVYIDNLGQAFQAALDELAGHVHDGGTTTTDFNADDRIEIVSGVRDRLRVRFGGGAYAVATYTITLTPGIYTPADLATHIQTLLRQAIDAGSPGSVPLAVIYDITEGAKTRGLFRFRHTGGTDTPNARILSLLFDFTDRNAAPLLGYRQEAKKGSNGYAGDSGFGDSYVQDSITLGNGPKLGTAGFVDGAFITRTFKSRVVTTEKIDDDAVQGSAGAGNVHAGAITGRKFGPPDASGTGALLALSYGTFAIAMANNRKPVVKILCHSGGATEGELVVLSVTHASGSTWDVLVANSSGRTITGIQAVGI